MGQRGGSASPQADKPPVVDQIEVQNSRGIRLSPQPAEAFFRTMKQGQERPGPERAPHQRHSIHEWGLGARGHGGAPVEPRTGFNLNPRPVQRADGGPQHLFWPSRPASQIGAQRNHNRARPAMPTHLQIAVSLGSVLHYAHTLVVDKGDGSSREG